MLGILLAAGCGPAPSAPPPGRREPPELPAGSLERGRLFTEWLYAGEVEWLWERFSPEVRELFGGVSGLRRFHEQVRSAGAEGAVIDERVVPWLGFDLHQ